MFVNLVNKDSSHVFESYILMLTYKIDSIITVVYRP